MSNWRVTAAQYADSPELAVFADTGKVTRRGVSAWGRRRDEIVANPDRFMWGHVQDVIALVNWMEGQVKR